MAIRASRMLAVLSSPPWRRAPGLLLRRPGVLAAVGGASAVLAASVAGVPLFLSSAGSESVAAQAAERCPRDTGARYPAGFAVSGVPPGAAAEVEGGGAVPPQLAPLGPGDTPADPFEPLDEKLGPSVLWLVHRDAGLRFADGPSEMTVAVLARDGALDNVEVLDGSPGPGLWLSDRAQNLTRLAPGRRCLLLGRGDRVPVAGIYRDEAVFGAWEASLGGDLTLADADDLVTGLSCGTGTAPRLAWCDGVDHRGGDHRACPRRADPDGADGSPRLGRADRRPARVSGCR